MNPKIIEKMLREQYQKINRRMDLPDFKTISEHNKGYWEGKLAAINSLALEINSIKNR